MTNGAADLRPHARLTLPFLLSLGVHAMIILGLGLSWPRPTRVTPPQIEITLARHPQAKEPRDFDFLAQANQDGGGSIKQKATPRKFRKPTTSAPASASPNKTSRELAQRAETRVTTPRKASQYPAKPRSNLADLIDTSHDVASSTEFSDIVATGSAHHPSERRIDERAHSFAAAEYMRQWVEKVERIGNLNYPREARERHLSGRLILKVTLRPDGSVYSINVLVPSSFRALDQAAQRIVKLAEPFARVPSSVLKGKDLLAITRSWEFDDDSDFHSH